MFVMKSKYNAEVATREELQGGLYAKTALLEEAKAVIRNLERDLELEKASYRRLKEVKDKFSKENKRYHAGVNREVQQATHFMEKKVAGLKLELLDEKNKVKSFASSFGKEGLRRNAGVTDLADRFIGMEEVCSYLQDQVDTLSLGLDVKEKEVRDLTTELKDERNDRGVYHENY